MAAKIKFFVTNPNGSKKSKNTHIDVNILARFYHGRQFDITSTSQLQINPKFWNNEAGKVRNVAMFKDSDEFQKKLDELKGSIIKDYLNFLDKSKINKKWLEKAIDKFYNPRKYLQSKTLFEFTQIFINNADKRVNPDTGRPISYKMKREYQVTFNYLKKYAKIYGEPDFIDIDLDFYERFVDMLRNHKIFNKDGELIKQGLATNTIGKKIQTLKIFLNNANEKGVNTYLKYKSKKFKSISEEVENIYLNKTEIQKLYNHDLSDSPSLERVRDLFIVGCWTGLRFSDLSKITINKSDSSLSHSIKQNKTGGKVVIPIHDMVREILKKYNDILPKPISNQKFNDYLKEAATLAEIDELFTKTIYQNGLKVNKNLKKYDLITSHTARRSFCTNAYLDGVPTLSIMAISGHKTEKAFLKYIKVEPEEHAKKMLEVWQKQSAFMKIAN